MAIDLTNPEAKQGAADALTILIKSKYSPIIVTQGPGSGNGPQLTPPTNIEIRNPKGDPIPQEPQEPQDPKEPQDQKQTKVTKTGSDTPDGQKENPSKNDSSTETNGKKSDLFDKEKNKATMAGIKDDIEYKKEKDEQEQAAEWAKMTSGVRVADFSELEDDLYYAIAAQVEENANIESGWSKGSKAWADAAGALAPKDLRTEPRKTKPLIYVFFDQSGSFGEELINKGKSILKCLDDFIKDEKIMPPKLFIFANKVKELGTDDSIDRGGTHGWPQCMNIIKKAQDLPLDERCTNVLVLSDRDIETQTDYSSSYNPTTKRGWNEVITVEGAVFWCWANNSRAKKAEEHLKGEAGNFRYQF